MPDNVKIESLINRKGNKNVLTTRHAGVRGHVAFDLARIFFEPNLGLGRFTAYYFRGTSAADESEKGTKVPRPLLR